LSGSDRSKGKGWTERRSGSDRRRSVNRRGSKAPRPRKASTERRKTERRGGDRRDESAWQSLLVEGVPEQALLAAAIGARAHAQAAYSNFKVGAALETVDGTIVTGCNIENATYGLTICAERVALFKALSEGHTTFRRIAIVADTEAPTPPCGACRQILWEFGGDLEVVLADLRRERGRHWLSSLLPLPFDGRLL
jgi:cytidine deaminase